MEESNIVNEVGSVVVLNEPSTIYDVACNIHSVLIVLTLFVMGFCMYRFLKSIIRK